MFQKVFVEPFFHHLKNLKSNSFSYYSTFESNPAVYLRLCTTENQFEYSFAIFWQLKAKNAKVGLIRYAYVYLTWRVGDLFDTVAVGKMLRNMLIHSVQMKNMKYSNWGHLPSRWLSHAPCNKRNSSWHLPELPAFFYSNLKVMQYRHFYAFLSWNNECEFALTAFGKNHVGKRFLRLSEKFPES